MGFFRRLLDRRLRQKLIHPLALVGFESRQSATPTAVGVAALGSQGVVVWLSEVRDRPTLTAAAQGGSAESMMTLVSPGVLARRQAYLQ